MKFKVGDVVWVCIIGRLDILGVVQSVEEKLIYPYIIRFDRDDCTHGTVLVREDEMTLVK